MKLNRNGISIIEVIITFSMIMFFSIGLLLIISSFRNKVTVSLKKTQLETFKNNLTQDINNDILTLGLKEIVDDTNTTDTTSPCYDLPLNRCLTLTFNDDSKKAFGTIKIKDTNQEVEKNNVINKYLFYDGIKYKLKDSVPDTLPTGRTYSDLQNITIMDDTILDSSYMVLEDGTKVTLYRIDVYIHHIDYKEDFGIHIVASTDNIS